MRTWYVTSLFVALGVGVCAWFGLANYFGDAWWRVVSMRDYNTRVVVLGVMLLGLASGLVGVYMFLQKRALLGDALAHATLPGIAVAFLFGVALTGDGKSLPWLLFGALIFGVAGVLVVQAIGRTTRLQQDAALGIVLSTFFGFGVFLLSLIGKMQGVDAAGLEHFIQGHTASMTLRDAWLTAIAAAVVLLFVLLLRKELALMVFDRQQAAAQGWPVGMLDMLLVLCVSAVVVIGLQSVGAILMLALLIIPPSAARFWTDRLPYMLVISGSIGALSGFVGAVYSALASDMPAGAIIVLVASACFFISMIFGRARGVLIECWRRSLVRRRIATDALLRRLYVSLHGGGHASGSGSHQVIDPPARLLRWLLAQGLIGQSAQGLSLTADGRRRGQVVARNYQLWRAYLLSHADSASGRMDEDLPELDAVLDTARISELEQVYEREVGDMVIPRPEPS